MSEYKQFVILTAKRLLKDACIYGLVITIMVVVVNALMWCVANNAAWVPILLGAMLLFHIAGLMYGHEDPDKHPRPTQEIDEEHNENLKKQHDNSFS